ncbi:hypothetical protein FT643_06905 [Ketobacter sp. MCCC 1A13808]|uniref:ankyrin repeat domain-containing protein n=1 Tax=Ketobacter sp. MCCC 1A13808 TaxID=2602738 RepID=UPI0012EBFF62|nr:ankyrin repeat domain-containing protein [Ketobacter sp. MCCC 1A13808]MVF11873.1 hypothetical protein [Ketobacter sp. MCCC 1A13808]
MKTIPIVITLVILMLFGGALYLNQEFQVLRAGVLYIKDKVSQECHRDYTQLLTEIHGEQQITQYAERVLQRKQICERKMGSGKAIEQLPQATKEFIRAQITPAWKELYTQELVEVNRIFELEGGEKLLFPERFPALEVEDTAQFSNLDLDYYRRYAREVIAVSQAMMDYYNGSGEEQVIANQLIQRVIAADENYAPAYVASARHLLASTYRIGRIYRDNGLNRAKVLINKALELDPDLAAAHSLLAYWSLQNFSLQEAQNELDQTRALDANDPWVEVNQARLYGKSFLNKRAESYHHFELSAHNKALPSLPRAIAYSELAELECETGNVKTAKKYYAEMIKLQPNISWGRGNLISRILLNCADPVWAERAGKETLTLLNYGLARQHYGWVLFTKAAQLHAEGKLQEARSVWQQALTLTDSYQEFYIRAAAFNDHKLFLVIYHQLPQLANVKREARADHGKSMLHLAIMNQRTATARWLIDQRISMDSKDDQGFNAMHFAAQTGQVEIMPLLKANGVGINVTGEPSGMSPLMQAIEYKQDDAALWLMKNGAEINHSTTSGLTVLGHAVTVGNVKIAEALLQAGANRGVIIYDQYTLQQAAVELKDDAMLAMLKRYPGTG